jgi:predicted nuclease of predicted toxin-antitoxin system
MLIKVDENLPDRLAAALIAHGHDVDTVSEEGLAGCEDPEVWLAAQRNRRFFVTQDLHFSDIRRFRPGTHAGILILRLEESGTKAIVRRVESLLESESVEEWAGCFVVATDRKVRVVRPLT